MLQLNQHVSSNDTFHQDLFYFLLNGYISPFETLVSPHGLYGRKSNSSSHAGLGLYQIANFEEYFTWYEKSALYGTF